MELREPPLPAARSPRPTGLYALLMLQSLLLLGLLVFEVVTARPGQSGSSERAAKQREVATKLKAAGAIDESSRLLEEYLETAELEPEQHARIAYSLGQTYLDHGKVETALRWFYEAEGVDDGALRDELGRKIVHSLERLGRFHAAQAALESRTRLQSNDGDSATHSNEDPVVAELDERQIRRSELQRLMDDQGAAAAARDDRAQEALLRQYVAEEVLLKKARKLEYDRDAEVQRRWQSLYRQLVLARYMEKEIFDKLQADEPDLRNYFEANRWRYQSAAEHGETTELSFEQVRSRVEQDYLQSKAQAAYRQQLESALETADVALYPERLRQGENE